LLFGAAESRFSFPRTVPVCENVDFSEKIAGLAMKNSGKNADLTLA